MVRVKRNNVFEHAQYGQIQTIFCMRNVSSGAFALHSYILCCPMILLADSEGPDQTARMRRLIRASALHICPKTRFSMGRSKHNIDSLKKANICLCVYRQLKFHVEFAFSRWLSSPYQIHLYISFKKLVLY